MKERAVKRAERDTRAPRDAWNRHLDELRGRGTGDKGYDVMRALTDSILDGALDERTRERQRRMQGNL